MTYEMYRNIFLGSAVACGICLAISVVLFFTLHIPKIISDLTGRTARKAIERIRLRNEQSDNNTNKPGSANLKYRKPADEITRSEQSIPGDAARFQKGEITEKLSTQELAQTDGTDVLAATAETLVLNPALGDVTPAPEDTMVLAPDEQPAQAFAIEYEITFLNSTEIIT